MPPTSTRLQQRHMAATAAAAATTATTSSPSTTISTSASISTSPDAAVRRRRKRPYRYYYNNAFVFLVSLLPVRRAAWLWIMTLAAATILLLPAGCFFVFGSSRQSPPQQLLFQVNSPDAPICRPLQPQDIDFTLVTQLSHDRLWMMKYHCQRYGSHHKMSVAVFSNHTLLQVEKELASLGCDLKHLFVSVLNARLYPSDEYPVNILRNEAIQSVPTSHLIYIDVDFWTSQDLYDILYTLEIRKALAEDPKLALVIPAFMLFRQCTEYIDCRSHNIPTMPTTKDEILQMMVNKRGHIFDPTNRGGHGSTLYKEWLRQKPGTLLKLQCLQSNRYEPFVVVRYCQDLPPFQTQFTGYGKNKVTWMMQLLMLGGYTLSQVGGAFVVHYPHLDSPARAKWNQAPNALVVSGAGQQQQQQPQQIRRPKKSDGNLHLASYKRGQVDQLFVAFREWLEEQEKKQNWTTETTTKPRRLKLCRRAQDDDSKLWIDHYHGTGNTTTTTGSKQQGSSSLGKQQQNQQQQQQRKKVSRQEAIQKDNARLEEEAAAAVQEEDAPRGGANGKEETETTEEQQQTWEEESREEDSVEEDDEPSENEDKEV